MRLTRRQYEVVKLVAEGYSLSEIADAMGITEQGVKHHAEKIVSRHRLSGVGGPMRTLRLYARELLRNAA